MFGFLRNESGARREAQTQALGGAQMLIEGQTRALLEAAEALERAAYTLRDKAELGFEAGKAMDASLAAKRAAGVE